jgi:hypothetical protein
MHPIFKKFVNFFNIFSGDKRGHAVTSCAKWCHAVPLSFLPPFFVVAVYFYFAKNILTETLFKP